MSMHALTRWFTWISSGDVVIASRVGPQDPYDHDPYWTLLEHRRLWVVPLLVLCIATMASLPFDLELSRWFLLGHAPGFIHKLSNVAEPFGNGLGVMFVCVVIFMLDKARRRDLVLVITSSLGAGLVTNLIKINVGRIRPYAYTFEGGVHETFRPWVETISFTSDYQSFPSGHATTAVGLAMALALLYPRSRFLFFGLAAFVGLHRVCVGAHYLSDVFAGATVGYLVGLVCCRVHLWKWRMMGVIATTPADGVPCVPPTHLDLDRAGASQSPSDGSGRGAPDENSECAAK